MLSKPRRNLQTQAIVDPSSILLKSLEKISMKYCTSESFHFSHSINNAIKGKRSSLKTAIRDLECNRDEQFLEGYFDQEEDETQLKELTEYYKYYTQTTINFQPNFFKLMHQNREKKKVVEYNRLKAILNLSDTSVTETERDHRQNVTPISDFNVLSKITFTSTEDEESVMLERLRSRLENEFGPSYHRTLEDVDRNYKFLKKNTQINTHESGCFLKRPKISKREKQNTCLENTVSRGTAFRKKRNNSCQSLATQTKRIEYKSKFTFKQKHKSVDNMVFSRKENLSASNIQRNSNAFLKPRDNYKLEWEQGKERSSVDNLKDSLASKEAEMRSKILGTKERIKREKELLKKKMLNSSTLNESGRFSKKHLNGNRQKFIKRSKA